MLPISRVGATFVPVLRHLVNIYDNGQMESFWARMQVGLLNRKRWNTRLELANAIFEYLEIFHNRQRRHTSGAGTARSTSRPSTKGGPLSLEDAVSLP